MKIAVYTIVKNEKIMLPIWYRYYSKLFDKADIFIIDNDTDDGSTDGYQNVIKASSRYDWDHNYMRGALKNFQKKYLTKYDYLVYADADELIYHKGDLKEYIEKRHPFETIQGVGYAVCERPVEKSINFDLPILKQRKYYVKLDNFYKPVISSKVVTHINNYAFNNSVDEKIIILHLHHLDYETRKEKTIADGKMNWSPSDLKTSKGWQHRFTSMHSFNNFFYNMPHRDGPYKPIPKEILELI